MRDRHQGGPPPTDSIVRHRVRRAVVTPLTTLWAGIQRRVGGLGVVAAVVVVLAAIPLLFVIHASLELDAARWASLWTGRMPGLVWNTLALSFLVCVGAVILGVSSAWLVARRQFVGRRLAIWLMVLPLAVPAYVLAHVYTVLLDDTGWLGRLWIMLFGEGVPPPDLFNIWGVTFVLSLATFSYVFLLVRAALERSNRNLEEAARIQGASPAEVFWRISLPLLRPAIAAGLAIVVLHVLSDFGAVSMLRFQTFTLSIYVQMSGRFDYEGAAGLSLVLVCLSLTFLILERYFRRRQRYYAAAGSDQVVRRRPATPLEQVVIWSWLGLIVTAAFVLPVAWMITWTWEAMVTDALDARFWGYAWNSISVAAVAATVALAAALPVALYNARRHSALSQAYVHLSSVGFVLPGPVIALGVLSFVLAVFPNFYGGLTALVVALMVRFLPLAVQSQEASLQQLTPSLEQAGRVLGAGPLENLWRVVLPMIRNGMAAAWVLVFIDVLKELPATLILRPTGFDTLPVRIWIEANEELLELAAPAALMLVVASLPALWIMMRTELGPLRRRRSAALGWSVHRTPA